MQLGLAALELWTRSHLPAACAKPAFCSKTAVKPAFWPPDGQHGLRTSLLAPKTASGRASWRPRLPPDEPPGVQDGLRTGLLASKTAPDGPPAGQDGVRTGLLASKTASGRASWRSRRLRTGLLSPKTASGRDFWLSTCSLFCLFHCACMTALLTKHLAYQLGCP